jgi:hypothetical protein
MAEQEVTVDLNLDDKELFQSAREEPKQEEAPAPEVEERPRDELGRFAPKTEDCRDTAGNSLSRTSPSKNPSIGLKIQMGH